VETSRIDEELNQWLRNAHAMEEQAEKMLEAQSSRIENYPELAAGIDRHLTETRHQKERLEQCLSRRGTSASGMKDVAAKFTGIMQGVGGSMASDEVVKGAMASYTFEHFEIEISAYRTLIAAAELAGDGETARVCTEICREEEAMASQLAGLLPQVATTYLQRSAREMEEAKR
jgi:ferritin-like metal-binding protein YciE